MKDKRYLNCKHLDAGMDGMLCLLSFCTTCREFLGDKCDCYTPKNTKKHEKTRKNMQKFSVEKQIKEMAGFMFFSKRKELADEYEKWVNTPLKDGAKIKDCALSVITFMQIKGYRKLPENSVVLSKEEYEKLKQLPQKIIKSKDDIKNKFKTELKELSNLMFNEIDGAFWDGVNEGIDKARQETAEKIFNKIKIKVLTEDMTEDRPQTLYRFTSFDIMKMAREIVEEFGVVFANGHATVEIKE